MAKKKNQKIIRYRKPLNINVGMIIFSLIFVYMVFNVYAYMGKEKIQFFEVVEGGIVNDKTYDGIVIRQESTKNLEGSGYVNYYVGEKKRASVGTVVYSLDETGAMANFLENNTDLEVTFTSDNLYDIKKQLSAFSLSYQDEDFSSAGETKLSLDAAVREYVSFNTLDNLDALMKEKGISFKQVTTDKSGIISYMIDSYDGLTADEITEDHFNKVNYSKSYVKTGKRVESGSEIFKVVTSELWSLVFPMSEEDIKDFGTKKALQVAFKEHNGLIATGEFSVITGADGKSYGKLDFDKYMVQFVSDRFVEFEIVSDKVTGLKIPVSSVTNKDFFIVPVEFLSMGGNSSETGFLKETLSDTGTATVFVPTTIYNYKDEFYYIDAGENSELKDGDYIIKPNSTERYRIGATASLEGVYNINKGYAVFKQIEKLASNEEYYTIDKGTSYGLSVYDHIVLDASIITDEGVPIYQ